MALKVKQYSTVAFNNQKAGTSGLRQQTKIFMQPNYTKNFVQSVINSLSKSIDIKNAKVLVCSDGRYYSNTAIQEVLNVLVANGVSCIFVPPNGHMATPNVSFFLKANKVDFALTLTASHNPAGENGDFGIKVNQSSGAPATAGQMESVYNLTKSIEFFKSLEPSYSFNIAQQASYSVLNTKITVDNFGSQYLDFLETIFDFKAIANYIKESGLNIAIDCLNAVTTVYAKDLCKRLGIKSSNILNKELKEDFGRYAADPNPKDAKHAYDMMVKDKKFDFACVFDGDGDRAMVLGKGIFIPPADNVAIISYYCKMQSFYKNKIYGFARSFATASSLDKVAEYLNVPLYVVPTGWKYFTNLLDNKKITICGEESFGASSFHVREKDGIWVFLFWLDILRITKQSVVSVTNSFYKKFGRSYFIRYDYNNLLKEQAQKLLLNLETNSLSILNKAKNGNEVINVYNFEYFDEFDNLKVKNQGLTIELKDGSRIVARVSGTATNNVTLRVYIEKYNPKIFNLNVYEYLKPLQEFFEEQSGFKNVVDTKTYNSLDTIG